jgi:hypothetical protein
MEVGRRQHCQQTTQQCPTQTSASSLTLTCLPCIVFLRRLCLQLLNKQHLAAALDVCEMRDGLVVFECAEDADKFASKLEEEGHSQVRAVQDGSTACVWGVVVGQPFIAPCT